jgi:hypothetical protein
MRCNQIQSPTLYASFYLFECTLNEIQIKKKNKGEDQQLNGKATTYLQQQIGNQTLKKPLKKRDQNPQGFIPQFLRFSGVLNHSIN